VFSEALIHGIPSCLKPFWFVLFQYKKNRRHLTEEFLPQRFSLIFIEFVNSGTDVFLNCKKITVEPNLLASMKEMETSFLRVLFNP
jgi:hypothetical protein